VLVFDGNTQPTTILFLMHTLTSMCCSPDGQFYSYIQGGCLLCPQGASCSAGAITPDPDYYLYLTPDGAMESLPCLTGYCVPCRSVKGANFTYTNETKVFTCCGENRIDAENNPLCGGCIQVSECR
jgi:hypothetical protein